MVRIEKKYQHYPHISHFAFSLQKVWKHFWTFELTIIPACKVSSNSLLSNDITFVDKLSMNSDLFSHGALFRIHCYGSSVNKWNRSGYETFPLSGRPYRSDQPRHISPVYSCLLFIPTSIFQQCFLNELRQKLTGIFPQCLSARLSLARSFSKMRDRVWAGVTCMQFLFMQQWFKASSLLFELIIHNYIIIHIIIIDN